MLISLGVLRTPLPGHTPHSASRGQYYDPETGLHYNYFRHYDPDNARYLTSDPLGLSPAPNPATYVHNPHTWEIRSTSHRMQAALTHPRTRRRAVGTRHSG
nr:RHS repeat-associated core domain-containing protein [Streptomyces sp. f150]